MKRDYHLIEFRSNFKPQKDWGVFLDRDGVIIKETPNRLKDIKDFKMIPQAFKAIEFLNKEKIPVFLTTNQTTVARGEVEEDFVIRTHEKIKSILKNKGVFLDGVLACLHSEKAEVKAYRKVCSWRKPRSGMFEFLIKKYNLVPKKSFVIGDSARDILAAQKLGLQDILVLTGHGGKGGLYTVKPNAVKKNVLKAVEYILKENV